MIQKIKYLKWKKIIQKSGLFDIKYYLLSYPDVRHMDICPIKHYIKYGCKEGKNPSAIFDTNFYLNSYKDVKYSGINPLVHYILYGKDEGRQVMIKKVLREVKINGIKSAVNKSVNKVKGYIKNETNIFQTIPKIVFDEMEERFINYHEYELLNTKVKAIAFYLPQFHPFPENDTWWGKGFTEWTNVTKAKPNYAGHYQPHLPIHNGFYDLRIPDVMIEQARLAKNYGIHGFNFYYYWFDGKILMHKPYEILLEHKRIDINFCITWANENWTRRWDGAEHDILIAQNHCDEDSISFIKSLFKYFNDDRYIRIDNKPVLIIYRVDIIPNIKKTVNLWRKKVEEAGFDGIYLICSQTFGIKSPKNYGFDASMEFPPHTANSSNITKKIDITNQGFDGIVYDYNEVVDNAIKLEEPTYKLFRTAMLSWDNTARKQDSSHIFENFSLTKYKQWISNLASRIYYNDKYKEDEKLIFINAWNEWAEGTHLEPDRKYGYGYLDSTRSVLNNYNSNNDFFLKRPLNKNNNIAVILHVHYTDLFEEISKNLSNLNTLGFDLYVSITNTKNNILEQILEKYPNANIWLVENRGRDILPFINIYNEINKLGYQYICKIHSKKSIYRNDGSDIRNEIYSSILGSITQIKKIIDTFEQNLNIGLITNNKYLINHTDHNMTYDKQIVKDLSILLNLDFKYSKFPAGSMFWFKPEALSGIEKIKNMHFDTEKGLADGTVAHGIERLFNTVVYSNNFVTKGI